MPNASLMIVCLALAAVCGCASNRWLTRGQSHAASESTPTESTSASAADTSAVKSTGSTQPGGVPTSTEMGSQIFSATSSQSMPRTVEPASFQEPNAAAPAEIQEVLAQVRNSLSPQNYQLFQDTLLALELARGQEQRERALTANQQLAGEPPVLALNSPYPLPLPETSLRMANTALVTSPVPAPVSLTETPTAPPNFALTSDFPMSSLQASSDSTSSIALSASSPRISARVSDDLSADETTSPTIDSADAKGEVASPPGPWRELVQQAIVSVQADLAQKNLDRDEKSKLEIRRRLLQLLTNDRDEAVSPIPQIPDDEQEFWKHLLHGLLVSLDADSKHATPRRAALALRDLRTATDHLANVSTLDVRKLSFCQEVLSYGEVKEFSSYTFRAKAEIVLYVEIDNFAAHPLGDRYETELHGSYEILDSAGRRVANVVLPIDKQVSNNRRRDYFIAYLITLPTQISPGSYRLQLTVEDVIGKKSNHAAVDFRIQ